MNSLRHYYNSVKYGIVNLVSYFNLIWNDRDYDMYYFYKFLYFKLKRIRNEIYYFPYFKRNNEIIDNLDKSIQALERLIDDDYCKEEYKEYTEEYGDLVLKDNLLVREKELSKEQEDNAKNQILQISSLENERRMEDIKTVCRIIESDSEKWWT